MTVRARTSRVILLSDYAALQNPGGIIVPPAIATNKRVSSARDILWNFAEIEFPDGENLCGVDLEHITYTGGGEWCGYFGNILNEYGYNNRYLNLTLSGLVTGLNNMNFIWYLYGDEPDPSTQVGAWTLEFSGGAAVDPSDNCSVANNLLVEQHTNGAPIPGPAWGWSWDTVGIDIVSSFVPDPVILNRTTQYGHPVSGLFPEDGINTPFGVGRMTPGDIAIVSDTEKQFIAHYGWFLGAFAGVWNSYGTAFVTLSNEQTLYDQLVLDGAQVTPTRGSRIISLDNETGEFEATVSVVKITIPDEQNLVGEKHIIWFRVLRTPDGGEPELKEMWHPYEGDGTSDRIITIQIPAEEGALHEFVGECVSILPDNVEYDNFERLEASTESALNPASWVHDEIGAWTGWENPMRFICGGTISTDSFRGLTSSPDEALALPNSVGGGQCWADDWRFLWINDLTWDDMEGKTDGETVGLWTGGVAWQGHGKFYEDINERSVDDMDDYADGAITELTLGANWSSIGYFIADTQVIAQDDMDDYADGAVTVLDDGTGWSANGYFIT